MVNPTRPFPPPPPEIMTDEELDAIDRLIDLVHGARRLSIEISTFHVSRLVITVRRLKKKLAERDTGAASDGSFCE